MIITLCGSGRFEPWFHMWNEALGLAGHAAFGLTSYASFHAGEPQWFSDEEKKVLDDVHRTKIAVSDAIFVLNVFAYMGESTLSEIAYAKSLGKTTIFLESWGQGCGIGMGAVHTEAVRASAKRYGVERFGSPIETSVDRSRPSIYENGYLGPGSGRRSRIVAVIAKREEEAREAGLPAFRRGAQALTFLEYAKPRIEELADCLRGVSRL